MAKKLAQEEVDFKGWYEAVGQVVGPLRGKEYISDCPDCGKKKHWHVNKSTGQHHCKVCSFSGNHYSYMQWMMDQGSRSGIEEIAAERSIPESALAHAELFKFDDEWWLPVFTEGKLVTIRKWIPPTQDKSGTLFNLPKVGGEGTFLYQLHTAKGGNEVVLCEGPWDAIALYGAFEKPDKIPYSIWAVPSANILRPKWYSKFSNKVVYLPFDNDKAGKEGMTSATEALREYCLEVRSIRWPKETAEGYDVRDLCKEHGTDAPEKLTELFGHHQPEIIRPVRTKFSEIIHDLKENKVKMNTQFVDVFSCILACAFVSHLEGDPLWFYVVGAPGCLTGDTIVEINRAGKSYRERLDKVVSRFNGSQDRKGGNGLRKWDLSIPTTIRGRDENGEIRLFPIERAVVSGFKEVFELTTRCGKKIQATADHQFLTNEGWKPLKALKVNSWKSRVCIDVGLVPTGKTKKKSDYPYFEGLKGHPFATKKKSKRFAVAKHRIVYEAASNGYALEDFVKLLRKGTPKGVKWLQPGQVIHHKDENPKNFNVDNLELIENNSLHTIRHLEAGGYRRVLAKTDFQYIKSIKKIGVKPTFDLTIGHSCHNFLANGIVVHNSGKTLLTNSLMASEYCFHTSKVTATQLVSGRNREDGSDPSLIPLLDNRTLIMKDYTEIIDMGGGAQAEMLSVLRGAYDRTLVRTYGSGEVRRYNSKFSIVAGVTGKIYQTTQAALGERFLRIHLDAIGGKDPSDQISAAMTAARDNPDMGRLVSPYVSAYLDYLKESTENIPQLTVVQQKKLIPIVRVVAHLRAATATGREREDLEAPPEIEAGTRTATQLQKLAWGLAVVLQKPTVDEHIFGILRRVARDTCRGYYQDIIKLSSKEKGGVTVNYLCKRLSLTATPIRKKLGVLKQLEIMQSSGIQTGKKGRPDEYWTLTPSFADLWKKSGIGE